MNALAIVNPAAGGGRCGKRAPAAIAALRDAGIGLDVIETTRAGDATDIARREWAGGRRTFLSAGGDGTTFEVINGLFPEAADSADTPRVGFLPLGTGNSFLRDFTTASGQSGAEYAIEAIRAARTRSCDVIRATHADGVFHYTNLLSIGFTAEVGAMANNKLKALGEAGYGLGVLYKVVRLNTYPLPFALDGGPIDSTPQVFLSFNNSKFTGGKMMMAPHADCADGLIECVVVGKMDRVTLLRTFPRIFAGTHIEHPVVHERRAREVRFDLPGPVDVMVDGEILQAHLQSLDVLEHAIEVIA